MVRLYIEGFELDVNQDFSHQITYAIDDIRNLDSKSTSFTKTIVLPATTRNNKLLGNIFELSNSNFTIDSSPNVYYNFNASKSANARIDVNSIQVMKGSLRLMEIIIDGENIEYEIAVFGELGGLISALGTKYIHDLNFSAYDHQYSIEYIQSSWALPSRGDGIYYPLIDYGQVSHPNDVQLAKHNYLITAFRPALYVYDYINKIITGAGYTWESEFLNTDYFKSLIIPNNQARFMINKDTIFDGTILNNDYVLAVNQGLQQSVANIIVNPFTGGLFSTSDNWEFTYNNSVDFSGTMHLNLNGTKKVRGSSPQNPVGSCNAYFLVLKNGSPIYMTDNIGGNATPYNWQFTPFNINIEHPIELTDGDVISIVLVNNYVSLSTSLYVNLFGTNLQLTTTYKILSPVEIGDHITMNDTIPLNIYQKDFLVSIIKMFYLMITEDNLIEKHLKIEPYAYFYNYDPSTYLDWTGKVDRSQPVRIKPMSELNARYYEMNYTDDSDYYNETYRKKYNEGYGNRVYDNNFEFTEDVQSVEVIFSPTPLVGYAGEDKVVSTILKLNDNVEEYTEHNIRILKAKYINDVSTWYIKSTEMDGFGNYINLATMTSYPYAGHFDDPDAPEYDINFGATQELFFSLVSGALSNNLFNLFYSPYLAEITDKDSRLLTCKIKFNELDIFKLDFSRLIYIDGVLFRLNKISDYSEGALAQVELLRLINTTYFDLQPPVVLKNGFEFYHDTNTSTNLLFKLVSSEEQEEYIVDFGDGNSQTYTGSFSYIIEHAYDEAKEYHVIVNCGDAGRIVHIDFTNDLTIIDYITSVNLSMLSNLELLYTYSTLLTSLDLSANTNLKYLTLVYCQLSTLDLSNNTGLLELNLSSLYGISELDLSNNQYLQILGLAELSLLSGYFDLTNHIYLSDLTIYNCAITDIDLSNCMSLSQILINACYDLSNVYMATMSSLQYVYVQNNHISSLDLSSTSVLSGLNCANNGTTYIALANGLSNFMYSDTSNNQLDSDNINSILAQHVITSNYVGFGSVTCSGQSPSAPPSGQGITDKQTLTDAGWYVSTD